MIHTVNGFCIVKKAEIDGFLELSCFFNDPADFGNLISGSSAFSKTSLNIWMFTIHVNTEDSLEGLIMKIKLQSFVQRKQRADSLEKTMIFQKSWKQEEQRVREDEKFG